MESHTVGEQFATYLSSQTFMALSMNILGTRLVLYLLFGLSSLVNQLQEFGAAFVETARSLACEGRIEVVPNIECLSVGKAGWPRLLCLLLRI